MNSEVVAEATRSGQILGVPKLLSDRQRRAELGDAMAYARKHDVPSKLFNAFWRYVGLARIKARLHNRTLEPGFEHRRQKGKKARIKR